MLSVDDGAMREIDDTAHTETPDETIRDSNMDDDMEVWHPPASPQFPARTAPSGHDVTTSSDSRITSMHPRSGNSHA